MDEKISLDAINAYGDRYAAKVVEAFFSNKNKISGSEILSLCNVQQINLFIIKELFQEWRAEQTKIRSHYFDYDQPEVKEALEQLMNLLSKNISITKVHFLPLVNKAASQALMAIFDPYDYFSLLITGKNNRLDVAAFREEIKYLKINKAPLERMLEKLEEKNVKEISGNEAFGILDQILEEVHFTPEDVEQYIDKFSMVEPLDPNAFFVSRETGAAEADDDPSFVPSAPVHKVVPPAPQQHKSAEQNGLYKQAHESTGSPTINEKHVREGRPSLAENFQRIKKIKDSLTINQKFMFTKVLFHGDFELFSKAVDRLDQLDSLQAALRYIEDEHASTWDRDSEEFHEFMELVEKRFG